MRQGQQNRRGRGRSNNNPNQNRKGQNPLTRSFESTGPDVKIRGTPAHVAEKYMALARDALSSGDPVLAENYLQHAEHYNRIIMAYREQQMAQGGGDIHGGMPRHRPGGYGEPATLGDEFGEDEGDELGNDMQPMQHQPQQRHEGQRYEGQRYDDRGERGPRMGHEGGHQRHHQHRDRDRDRHGGGYQDRHERSERFDRGERQERFQRPDRGDRPDRGERGEQRMDRSDRGERFERGDRPERHERQDRPEQRQDRPERAPQAEVQAETGAQPQVRRSEPRPAAVPHHEQPEFLRRPVRRPRREAAASGEEGAAPAVVAAPAAPATEGSGE